MVLVEFFADDPEPIPAWQEGNRGKLKMLCGCTEVSVFGEHQYENLAEKVAKLFYSAIKTHPFPNGNKRFALVAVLVLLVKNQTKLQAYQGEVAEKATWVADANPLDPATKPEVVIRDLVGFFEPRIARR